MHVCQSLNCPRSAQNYTRFPSAKLLILYYYYCEVQKILTIQVLAAQLKVNSLRFCQKTPKASEYLFIRKMIDLVYKRCDLDGDGRLGNDIAYI